MTIATLSRSIAERLIGAGVPADEARLDAELLIRSALDWDRARWISERQALVPHALPERLAPLVARREAREPMAYLLGRCEFWGREFAVGPGVLIPRPETELIVEQALSRIGPEHSTLVDVGTGSGCLAITLLLERPRLRALATDISAQALAIARRNASRHGVADRLVFQQTAMLGVLGGRGASLVVSNPPYVPAPDRLSLPPEVQRYEPPEALFAGDDGLDVIRSLVDCASQVEAGGWLIFEFGFGQDAAVRDLLSAARLRPGGPPAWRDIATVADLQGIPRVAHARRG